MRGQYPLSVTSPSGSYINIPQPDDIFNMNRSVHGSVLALDAIGESMQSNDMSDSNPHVYDNVIEDSARDKEMQHSDSE